MLYLLLKSSKHCSCWISCWQYCQTSSSWCLLSSSRVPESLGGLLKYCSEWPLGPKFERIKVFFKIQTSKGQGHTGDLQWLLGTILPPATGKHWPCFFCFPCFESLHRTSNAVKKRTALSPGLQEKEKWLPCWNDISHICVALLQCKPSVLISSSYHTSLYKIGALDLKQQR